VKRAIRLPFCGLEVSLQGEWLEIGSALFV
jgi:hypothetical protein